MSMRSIFHEKYRDYRDTRPCNNSDLYSDLFGLSPSCCLALGGETFQEMHTLHTSIDRNIW